MRLSLMLNAKFLVEQRAFDFFSDLGDWMKVSSGSTRLFFIYTSFITLTSPLVIALVAGYLSDIPKHFRRRRSAVWDL